MAAVAGIILAAGLARRFGLGPEETKVTANLDGKPLVRHVAETALASHLAMVVAVTGHASDKVAGHLAGLDLPLVHNPHYADGLATSLAAGIAALPDEIEGAVVLLADMPRVSSQVIDLLIAAFDAESSRPDAVIPEHQGQRGNPVLVGRRLFPEIAKLQGDRGAMALLRDPGRKIVACPVEDPAILLDIDTQAALDSLRREG